jgi:hypothetical protein
MATSLEEGIVKEQCADVILCSIFQNVRMDTSGKQDMHTEFWLDPGMRVAASILSCVSD